MSSSETIIKLSKAKITLLTFCSFGLVAASVWILSFADTQTRYNPEYLKLVAYLAILLFSIFGIYGLIKLFDQKPGLIINSEGITDNSSAVSGQIIKWSDILKFDVAQVQKTQFLLIFVNNPDNYLNRVGKIKRSIMKMNAQMYGTPLCISSVSLNCNFDDLVALITAEWEKHQSRQ